jgi:hypothetical protein
MRLLTALLLFFTFFSSFSQWTSDTAVNTLVADSEGGDMKAIGASDGKTYVVFWKVVAPPTNYELRMQLVDVDGALLLGSDGMLVSNAVPMSTFTVIWNIAIDTDDNLYIGVTGTGGGDPAYAFKLDSSGAHLWGANGINVGSGNIVTLLPLANGQTIVSWYPGGQALMQKYDATGTALWTNPQPVVSGGSNTIPGNLFELSGNDFIMVFHVPSVGINSTLYAQRFDSDGNAVWGATTQLSNQATAFNRSYGGTQDGNTIYYGYFSSSGVRFDSFLQRINEDGSLPWGINGSDFDTNETDFEMDTRIAYNPGSQHIWAVCNYTNVSQSERGEYVQKFDKTTGGRLFSNTSKEVFNIGSENVHVGALQLKNDSPLFLMKSGLDNGATPTTLHVVYLDTNGDFVWPQEFRPVATFLANKSRIHFTRPVDSQSVAVFIENKGGGARIYAQNFIDEILATDEFDISSAVFYPIPISNQLNIYSEEIIKSIQIVTLLGQKVFIKNNIGRSNLSIEVSTWKAGMYVIQINTVHGGSAVYKVLKE